MDLALIGFPGSGKSSVFSLLTHGRAGRAVSGQGRIAVIKLPDERLEKLADLVSARVITRGEVRLHDLELTYGQQGALSGDLSGLGAADVLLHVVRAFRRDDVAHPRGSVDPSRDIKAVADDLFLHDIGIVERRLERVDQDIRFSRPTERGEGQRERALLLKLKEWLEDRGSPQEWSLIAERDNQVANYGLLAMKPVILVINIGEGDLDRISALEDNYRSFHSDMGRPFGVVALSARLEAELAEMKDEEASEFRSYLGVEGHVDTRILDACRSVLSVITFYTLGDEAKAWQLLGQASVHRAAGKIHSDIERGFIRAEVVCWKDLLAAGSETETRRRGLLRIEGKEYIVQDGDVIHVLFSV